MERLEALSDLASAALQAHTTMHVGDIKRADEIINAGIAKYKRKYPTAHNSIMLYIFRELKNIEMRTGFITVVQFATHPTGNLAMVFRAHNPRTGQEYTIPDVILLSEVECNDVVNERLDVLFRTINDALNQIQVIKAGAFHA